ncbi:hypothetical protein TNCV_5076761 [Trichonephila clavipes]|uniref:Uncharacterized protein n=1 Tax=Trichonephila clavipes TaxID=2585209 RepID=A0A8X6VBA3_TRICX|nr:hypothetical protein TNCV_5076761 [Trichonephila clavipes]
MLMHVRLVAAQNSHTLVWYGVEVLKVGCQLRCRSRHLTEVRNYELQETKLPLRLINTPNERRLVQGHETTPLRVKGDIEDVSSELDNGS